MMQKTTKSLLAGVAFGAIAGAVAGVLMAPKSGKETREDVKKYFGEMKDKIAEELSKVGEFTKENYRSAVDRVVGVYEAAKKISPQSAEEIRAKLDENFEKVEDVVKKSKRRKNGDEE